MTMCESIKASVSNAYEYVKESRVGNLCGKGATLAQDGYSKVASYVAPFFLRLKEKSEPLTSFIKNKVITPSCSFVKACVLTGMEKVSQLYEKCFPKKAVQA